MRLERIEINNMINIAYRGNKNKRSEKNLNSKNALFDPQITLA
jgi:hypothetical protein